MFRVAGLLVGQGIGQAGLPDVRRDGLNLRFSEAEIWHLRAGTKLAWFFQPNRNPVLVQLEAGVLQVRSDLLHVLHQTVRAKVDLLQPAIDPAVGDAKAHRLIIQPIGFVIALGGIGLLHHVSGLLGIVEPLRFERLDLLVERLQLFGFFIVAFIAMAAHAAALAEEVFALADGPAHLAADQHHVGGMAGLASGFEILLRVERPEPMLVIAMCFFDAGGRTPIPLVARRAAEFLGIVNLQEVGIGMAHECFCVIVGSLGALRRHRSRSQLYRLANTQMAGFAAIDDIGFRDIDLLDRRAEFVNFLFQASDLRRGQIDHVIGDVIVESRLRLRDRLERVT